MQHRLRRARTQLGCGRRVAPCVGKDGVDPPPSGQRNAHGSPEATAKTEALFSGLASCTARCPMPRGSHHRFAGFQIQRVVQTPQGGRAPVHRHCARLLGCQVAGDERETLSALEGCIQCWIPALELWGELNSVHAVALLEPADALADGECVRPRRPVGPGASQGNLRSIRNVQANSPQGSKESSFADARRLDGSQEHYVRPNLGHGRRLHLFFFKKKTEPLFPGSLPCRLCGWLGGRAGFLGQASLSRVSFQPCWHGGARRPYAGADAWKVSLSLADVLGEVPRDDRLRRPVGESFRIARAGPRWPVLFKAVAPARSGLGRGPHDRSPCDQKYLALWQPHAVAIRRPQVADRSRRPGR